MTIQTILILTTANIDTGTTLQESRILNGTYNGRPTELTGREDREIRVYDLLDSLGIEYQRTDHGHADTMEACNEIDAVLMC